MEIFKIEDLTFAYPASQRNVLDRISFSVAKGEFITVCGLSGCGKSTLLRHMKTVLCPYGKKSGKIIFNGDLLENTGEKEQASKIGFVMQSPDYQTVTDKVWHELAFALENLGYDHETIMRKSGETASFFGMESWYHKKISELSGGQRQILNIASVMITSPDILILDEPTAQLDPLAAQDLMQLLIRINRELGTTIIMSEHELGTAFSCSYRIITMSDGTIISDDTPERTAKILFCSHPEMAKALPVSARVHFLLDSQYQPVPFTISEGRNMLSDYLTDRKAQEISIIHTDHSKKETPVLELRDIYFRYNRKGTDILRGASLKAYGGEVLSIAGGNGSGKTTLLTAAAGLHNAYSGKIYYNGRTKNKSRYAYLPQNPQSLFIADSVREELNDVISDTVTDQEQRSGLILKTAKLCGLEKLLDRHPYDLSGGEQQKAGIAKILLTDPDVLFLDEPVKGMDVRAKNDIGQILRQLAKAGKSIILVSHDMDFCARYSDRCAMLFDGQIIGMDEPHDFFCGNHFYTTSARKLTQGLIKNCITEEDILSSFGIKADSSDDKLFQIDIFPETPPKKNSGNNRNNHKPNGKTSLKKSDIRISWIHRSGKHTAVTSGIVFFLIPLTIYVGIHYLNDTKYLFISLLIMLECMLPFFVIFERRHVKTRELVLIAAMCALCVTARAAFYMFPEFKPLTAMVIISGAALGGETGFLIGSISMLCSNIIFGQGPWTPWQMFAMGLIGLLSGIIFSNNRIPTNRIIFAVFGFISALLIYGGIMDPAAAVMSHIAITPESALAYYAAGLPLDLIHAASTAFFLFFGSQPILKKLERIKVKYGLTL